MSEPTEINISSVLSEKAMIVRLVTSGWSGRITDKAITRELTEIKRAKENSVSVTKALVDKRHFKRIRDANSAMKRYHNEMTMPWDNNGGRLLPSTEFAAYNLQLRESKRELQEASLVFMAEYESYIEESEEILGDIFNRSDYPSMAEIEGKFLVDANFEKVPEADDFRVDVPEAEQARIREQIASRVEAQHAQSMKRVWLRIFKAVEHMNERLSEEDSIFRDSLVENVEQLVNVLPALNITEDPTLAEMTNTLRETLCGFTPEDLRRNRVLRQEVVQGSQEVMDKIKQMESVFGPVPPIETTPASIESIEETDTPGVIHTTLTTDSGVA